MKDTRRPFLSCRGVVFFLLVLLLVGVGPGAAFGSSAFLQRIWQSGQGMPHNLVNCLLQTRDGYIWVGTRRGVARFDGVRFKTVEIPELRIQNVTSLCEDRNGHLWAATEGGVYHLQQAGTLLYERTNGLAGDNVRALCTGRDGSIWIGTSAGLSQLKEGKLRNFTRNDGLAHNIVRALCEDDDGTIWIGTDGGLNQLKNSVVSAPPSAGELPKGVRAICLDHQRKLCVGTENGLYRRTGTGWDQLSKSHGRLSDNFVSALYNDRKGRLWIGTYGGLNWIEGGKIHTEFTADGAAYDQVNGIMEDHEGSIWVGSKEGLTRLKARPFTPITRQHGLTYNNTMSILEDRAGTFWCGTWGGGLFEVRNEGEGIVVTNTFPNSRVLSLCEGRDGSLWFGTDHGGGLYRKKNGVWQHYDEKDGLGNIKTDQVPIPVLCEDRSGSLWIGTSRALIQFKDGKFVHYTTRDGLAGNTIRSLFEDREGVLWIGTNEGLTRYQDGKFTNFTTSDGLSHDMVLDFHEDKEGALWIATAGGGLCRMRREAEPRFTSYGARDGLFSNEALEVLEDDDGYLWMTCLRGIYRVSKKALDQFDRKEIESIPCTSYGADDGLLSIVCCNVAKPATWKGTDGRLWFATTKGLAVADPGIKASEAPPTVFVEELLADKRVVTSRHHYKTASLAPGRIDKNIPGINGVKIPPGRGELEIHYTALSLQAPEKNRFKYKLEGVDPEWVDAETRRVAYYNNLPPGDYTFRVMACNPHSIWNTTGETMKFTLLPHYWQTLWFKLSLAGLGLCLAAGGARIVTQRRMQSKLMRLEQQHAVEKERTRIAQDMHDDLGVRLSEILLLSNMAEKDPKANENKNLNRKISQATRELVDNLDAIVWAVNPRNDSLETFVHYLYEFAPRYLQMSGIRCLFDSPMDLPDFPLASEVRHNLFLVVKEALYNIVKHARASEVQIHLVLENNSLSLAIADNGKGFSGQADSAFGNGLLNMKQRMATIGGKFELVSEAGKGSRIMLQIPLRQF